MWSKEKPMSLCSLLTISKHMRHAIKTFRYDVIKRQTSEDRLALYYNTFSEK